MKKTLIKQLMKPCCHLFILEMEDLLKKQRKDINNDQSIDDTIEKVSQVVQRLEDSIDEYSEKVGAPVDIRNESVFKVDVTSVFELSTLISEGLREIKKIKKQRENAFELLKEQVGDFLDGSRTLSYNRYAYRMYNMWLRKHNHEKILDQVLDQAMDKFKEHEGDSEHLSFTAIYVRQFMTVWGSTALGFGGAGGSMPTTSMTTVVFYKNSCCVFYDAHFAYYLDTISDVLIDDLSNGKIRPVARYQEYLEGK